MTFNIQLRSKHYRNFDNWTKFFSLFVQPFSLSKLFDLTNRLSKSGKLTFPGNEEFIKNKLNIDNPGLSEYNKNIKPTINLTSLLFTFGLTCVGLVANRRLTTNPTVMKFSVFHF